jgi:hypothetical protein
LYVLWKYAQSAHFHSTYKNLGAASLHQFSARQ